MPDLSTLVSIIIPSYNHAAFLEQRLYSVLNQTYENFEVILLDDHSTDHSQEILEKYRHHPKVSKIDLNTENSGSPFAQWEKGIALAQGNYIWIAESDDFCELTFLEKLMPSFKKMDNVGLVYARSINVDSSGKIFNEYWPDGLHPEKWKSDYCNNGIAEIKNFLKYRNTIPNASACIFKKEKFDFSEIQTMFYAGDWLFWVQLLLKSNLCFVSETLNYFRFHEKTTRSITRGVRDYKKYKEYQKVLLYIYSSIGEKFVYNREHQWIYLEFRRLSVPYFYLYRNLNPFFKNYVHFRYKLLKYNIRTKVFKK